jgi:hypothetical protein
MDAFAAPPLRRLKSDCSRLFSRYPVLIIVREPPLRQTIVNKAWFPKSSPRSVGNFVENSLCLNGTKDNVGHFTGLLKIWAILLSY